MISSAMEKLLTTVTAGFTFIEDARNAYSIKWSNDWSAYKDNKSHVGRH